MIVADKAIFCFLIALSFLDIRDRSPKLSKFLQVVELKHL